MAEYCVDRSTSPSGSSTSPSGTHHQIHGDELASERGVCGGPPSTTTVLGGHSSEVAPPSASFDAAIPSSTHQSQGVELSSGRGVCEQSTSPSPTTFDGGHSPELAPPSASLQSPSSTPSPPTTPVRSKTDVGHASAEGGPGQSAGVRPGPDHSPAPPRSGPTTACGHVGDRLAGHSQEGVCP